MVKEQRVEGGDNTRAVLYMVGIFTLLLGGAGLATTESGLLNQGVYGLAIGCGLLILVATRYQLTVAKYLACVVIVLLTTLSLNENARDVSILGYAVSIALAGVLIGGRAIPIISAVAILAYVPAAFFGKVNSLDPISFGTMVGAVSILALLLTLFADAQQRTATAAQAAASRAERSLEALTAGVDREASTKAQAGGLAGDILNSSEQQRGVAGAASTATNEIEAQIAELSAATRQIAAAASQLQAVSNKAVAATQATQAAVMNDREQLATAAQHSSTMQEAAIQMVQQAGQMNLVLDIIAEIASETHLLSLNATIEAVGAGPYGRRFTVIASEVSQLASRVNDSAAEVRSLITEVLVSSRQIQQTADQTLASIRGSQAVQVETTNTLGATITTQSEVAQQSMMIVAATRQQERAATLIETAMQDVTGLSRQSASLSEQLTLIAQQLNTAMARLATSIPTLFSGQGSGEGIRLWASGSVLLYAGCPTSQPWSVTPCCVDV